MGSKVIIVEKTWMCGCGQQSDYCGENMDVWMWAVGRVLWEKNAV